MNRYYYIDSSGIQKGTYSADELRQERISKSTMVWTRGMSNWKPASEVEDLAYLFEPIKDYHSGQPGSVPPPPQFQQQTSRTARDNNMAPMPKTWLTESILITVLPFMLCSNMLSLLGIVAIVYASKVESLYLRGDYAGAIEAARQAKSWTKITFWVAIGWILILILLVIGFIVFGVSMAGVGSLFGSLTYLI